MLKKVILFTLLIGSQLLINVASGFAAQPTRTHSRHTNISKETSSSSASSSVIAEFTPEEESEDGNDFNQFYAIISCHSQALFKLFHTSYTPAVTRHSAVCLRKLPDFILHCKLLI